MWGLLIYSFTFFEILIHKEDGLLKPKISINNLEAERCTMCAMRNLRRIYCIFIIYCEIMMRISIRIKFLKHFAMSLRSYFLNKHIYIYIFV